MFLMAAANLRSLTLRILRCCASSKRIVGRGIHITLFDVSTVSWKTITNGLNFVTQTWGWLTNTMIQTPFTYGTYSSVKWSRNQTITKPFQPDKREARTSWNRLGCYYLRPKDFVASITGHKISWWYCILNKDHERLRRVRSHGRT